MPQFLQYHLIKPQKRIKLYGNQRRSKREFQVWYLVFLKLKPYKQSSLALRIRLKPSSEYYGHFKVFERIGAVEYKLKLSHTSLVHHVFHLYLLKKKVGSKVLFKTCLPATGNDGQFFVTRVAVLQRKMVHTGNVVAVKILV